MIIMLLEKSLVVHSGTVCGNQLQQESVNIENVIVVGNINGVLREEIRIGEGHRCSEEIQRSIAGWGGLPEA